MKKLFVRLLVIILPVGLMVGLFNYFVDPANIFAPASYIGGIADILSRGHNVNNLSNYNERLLQEQLLKKQEKPVDVMILGSSRVMEIGSDFFPGRTVLNCGVSHGNINDLVSIVGLADSLGRLPQEVVIGLDHFLIGQGASREWKSLYAYRQYFLSKYDTLGGRYADAESSDPPKKLISLLSLDYFKSSIDFFSKRISKKYFDVGKEIPSASGRLSDGTVHYTDAYANPDTLKTAIDARVTGLKLGIPLMDTTRIVLFDKLLDFLQQKKIKVSFVMIPYHPEFYKALQQRQGALLSVYADLFRSTAERRHIPMIGSFDADGLGMPRKYFYDLYHCSRLAIKKYVMVEQPADRTGK